MKLCVITPTSHLDLAGYGNGIHMALTHLTENDDYCRAYQRYRNKGEYIILDNSAFEMEQQGKGLDPLPVLIAARKIGVDEVIATDVLLKGSETVKSTRNFVTEYQKFYSEEIRLGKPVPKIMAVPQGNTIEEWTDCYIQLLATPGVNVIGFSKIAVPVAFGGPKARKVSGGVTQSRLKLYEYLSNSKLWPSQIFSHQNIQIHLLGGDNWSGHEIQTINKLRYVIRSNDTSAPVWYGANGIAFDPFTGKAPEFIEQKPDLENHRQDTAEKIKKNLALIQANISVLLKMSNS